MTPTVSRKMENFMASVLVPVVQTPPAICLLVGCATSYLVLVGSSDSSKRLQLQLQQRSTAPIIIDYSSTVVLDYDSMHFINKIQRANFLQQSKLHLPIIKDSKH